MCSDLGEVAADNLHAVGFNPHYMLMQSAV